MTEIRFKSLKILLIMSMIILKFLPIYETTSLFLWKKKINPYLMVDILVNLVKKLFLHIRKIFLPVVDVEKVFHLKAEMRQKTKSHFSRKNFAIKTKPSIMMNKKISQIERFFYYYGVNLQPAPARFL